MKKKEFLTEAKRKLIIADKEKSIIESFAKTFNKIKRIDENEINEFEEENPLYSRQQQNKNAYQERPNVSFEPMNANEKQMAEYVGKYVDSELELSHEMDNYRNLGYQGLSDAVKLGLRNDMDYQSWVQMSHDEDTFRRERGGVDENEMTEMGNNADNDGEIKLFPFSSNFIDIINGVEKTKNDLKDYAGAMFGGASEGFYKNLSIALNDFYKNIYKPIEAKYIQDMEKEHVNRRKLYPQEYEK